MRHPCCVKLAASLASYKPEVSVFKIKAELVVAVTSQKSCSDSYTFKIPAEF